ITDLKNADFFALATLNEQTCIQGFFYRNGSNYGTHSFFLQGTVEESKEDIFEAFLLQFYAGKEIPPYIFTNFSLEDPLLQKALQQNQPHKITLAAPQRGTKRTVLETAFKNAVESLQRQLISKKKEQEYLENLSDILDLSRPLKRIEVYDNSHIQGTNAIGSMIVSGMQGFEKKHYRKFTIKSAEITPGDDFGMMAEVLKRRFQGSLTKDKERSPFPDLVIIDGGKGQLSAAQKVFDDFNIDIPLLAIAKGPDRNAGKETFFTKKSPQGFKLSQHLETLHYLQRLRDEAHRFAVTFHRAKRTKGLQKSLLDTIPGIGAARKRALLQHFGSAVAVKSASIEDIQNVEGISKNLAKKVYLSLHSS
ncbi:MAG: excinuclease ABC subunit UvrC, partial [Alphaproteobacteria bacterium]|nr:excinuclease ABC subunit UvrC [Alphaproteobacteria bacterium]